MLPVDEPPITPELIRDRVATVRARLRTAAEGAGRDPDGVRLVAVTKGFELDAVRAARAAGLTVFGENRVQEAASKVEAMPDAEWHMIGRLQSNKVRLALGLFRVIHSVESLELLQRIERIAHDDGPSAAPAASGRHECQRRARGVRRGLVRSAGQRRRERHGAGTP